MRVQDVMRGEVRRVGPVEDLGRAAQEMWDGDCGCLPVVDDARRVIGMLTDRDLAMAAYTRGLPLASMTVDSAMSRSVVRCWPSDSLDSALELLRRARLRRLPVVDDQERLVGILTLSDLARTAWLQRSAHEGVPALWEIGAALADVTTPHGTELDRQPLLPARRAFAAVLAASARAATP